MTERFTLLTELGRSDMGVVWKARDEETGPSFGGYRFRRAARANCKK